MPEYAELHHSSHQINDAAYGHLFVRAEVNLDWTQASSLGLRVEATEDQRCIPLPGTEALQSFEIISRHRGKEVCMALRAAMPGARRVVSPSPARLQLPPY